MDMKKEIIYEAVGEIDPDLLEDFEQNYKITRLELAKRKEKKSKQTWKILQVAACFTLLMGAGTGLVREFADGSVFKWKDADKKGFHWTGEELTEKFYEEREDGLYYIFDGAEVDVTEYCSETDYVLIPDLDAGGTGYIAVLGGEKGERGLILNHYEQGELLIGQTEHELVKDSRIFSPSYDEIDAKLPQFIWNHHAIHFMGHELEETWYQSPDIIENDYGTAEKVGENLFFVQGYELGFYTPGEQLHYAMEECFMQVDWLSSFGGDHTSQLNQEGDTLLLYVYDDWTEEREAEICAVLDEIGFPYVLNFAEG